MRHRDPTTTRQPSDGRTPTEGAGDSGAYSLAGGPAATDLLLRRSLPPQRDDRRRSLAGRNRGPGFVPESGLDKMRHDRRGRADQRLFKEDREPRGGRGLVRCQLQRVALAPRRTWPLTRVPGGVFISMADAPPKLYAMAFRTSIDTRKIHSATTIQTTTRSNSPPPFAH